MSPRAPLILTLMIVTVVLAAGPAPAQSVIDVQDFDDWDGWYASNGVWQIGEATVGPVGSGNVAGTVLDGNYPYQANSTLTSPEFDLPAAPLDGALWLRLAYWFNNHTSDGHDYGRVRIHDVDEDTWTTVSRNLWGWSPVWSEFMADLTEFAGKRVEIGIQIVDVDGNGYGHSESHGLYIDHVQLLEGAFAERSLQTFDYLADAPDFGWGMTHTSWEGWSADNGAWEVGVLESDPPRSGERCAATRLDGNYSYLADSRLVSPPLALPADPADDEIWLAFWSASGFHYSDGTDYGQVEIRVAGGDWEELMGDFVAYGRCWSPCAAELSAYAGQVVQVAFHIVDVDGSGYGHNESWGWAIDDVAVVEGRRWINNVEACEGTITGWASRQGLWQFGAPTSGPGSAHSGDFCWGTRLGGNYGMMSRSTLESTWVDVPAGATWDLCFYQWFSLSSADGTDYGQIKVVYADGADVIDEISGSSGGWSRYCIDLAPYAGQRIRVRLRLVDVDGSGYGHNESSGWYIDDFELVDAPISEAPMPTFMDVDWSGPAPEISYYADPDQLEAVCLYYTHDLDAIPDLSNRVAVLPAGFGSYVDEQHPRYRRYYHVTGIDALGHESTVLGPHVVHVEEPDVPVAAASVVLHGARPNPFNPRTELRFTMLDPARVVLEIYDLRGRLVSRLRDEPMDAGTHTIAFSDARLPSGTYVARLRVGDRVKTCKMMLMR